MTAATVTATRPAVTAAPTQTRTWFAQVVVPGCDTHGDRQVDGIVDLLIGDIEVGPGEVALARSLAEADVLPLGYWVSSVWFEGMSELEF